VHDQSCAVYDTSVELEGQESDFDFGLHRAQHTRVHFTLFHYGTDIAEPRDMFRRLWLIRVAGQTTRAFGQRRLTEVRCTSVEPSRPFDICSNPAMPFATLGA
jgi:hypothetical protein